MGTEGEKARALRHVTDGLARRVQRIRQDRGLTLTELSDVSGVSRSMISQIERGTSSPTVATLLNLTRALDISLASLIETDHGARRIEVVRRDSAPVIGPYAVGCTLRILSPPERAETHEVYDVSMDPGGRMSSEPHSDGCTEQIVVLEGSVTVVIDGDEQRIDEGDTALYPADVTHEISASDSGARVLLMVHFADRSP